MLPSMGLSGLASLALLAVMAAAGAGSLRRLAPFLDSLERWAYGAVLGTVVCSLLLFALAIPLGLSRPLVVGLVVGGGVAAFALRPFAGSGLRSVVEALRALTRSRGGFVALAVMFGFIGWLAWFWCGALTVDSQGLWASQANLWADWAQHLGDATAFAWGDNFPPAQTRFAGAPLAYHYLTSVTAAAMVVLGMTPWAALALQSFVFCVLVVLSIFALARRMTGDRAVSALTVVLFLVGGGLGWIVTMNELATTAEPLTITAAFSQLWDSGAQRDGNFRWLNVFFSSVAPQRAYLYGLPLFGLIVTALTHAIEAEDDRAFVLAGAVAGLLPLAHLGTMLALALTTPFMFLLLPRRGWVRFFALWIAVAVPQLLFQQGGAPGALAAFRFAPGWVASPDSWAWFWVKNLGFFSVALVLALADRSLMNRVERRILGSFMALFVIANLFVFQPWDWDNTKLLVFWYLAACVFVSAWLVRAWRRHSGPAPRLGLALVMVTMLLSGTLQGVHQLLGFNRHLLLTADELELARRVRDDTDPHALFLTGKQHNHPIHVLAGRRVVMGYPGWLWSQGYAYKDRERDVRSMFEMSPAAEELLRAYGIDYLVVGPAEKVELGADLDRFRSRYSSVIRTDTYEVFEVGRTTTE
jgi:hypothetical protein